MSKIFYDHLIVIEDVIIVLDNHKLSKEERKKIMTVIDETMHHHVLDEILTHLPKEHHELFLTKFTRHPYDIDLIPFLKERTPDVDIEKEILLRAETVKKQLINEIQKHSSHT